MAKKNPLGMRQYVVYGAILTTLFGLVVGQEASPALEASPDKTMMLAVVCLILGGIGGFVFGKMKLGDSP
jgi:hypothetical protein